MTSRTGSSANQQHKNHMNFEVFTLVLVGSSADFLLFLAAFCARTFFRDDGLIPRNNMAAKKVTTII
jgi:hypothetical protein